MSEAEKLMADVPAQDPRFELAVMARIEQRRFRRELARTGVLAVAAIILLALVIPRLGSLMAPIMNVSLMTDLFREYSGALVLALTAVMIFLPRLSRS